MKLIHVHPRATEKAYRLVTAHNTYVFNVPLNANKQEIATAVEAQFEGTKVAKVTTVVQVVKQSVSVEAKTATLAQQPVRTLKRPTLL